MRSVQQVVLAGVVGLVFSVGATPLAAQHPVEGSELMIRNLRPRGQPVIPIFDGWIPRADGTYDLCFGYFNLNTEEAVDIPLGPDNFIEPKQFDGRQPTHFQPVPKAPNDHRRYFCSFRVNVPADFGEQRVVWTLRLDGRTYSVPGHTTAVNYVLEEPDQASRGVKAPVMKLGASGPEGRGRSAGPSLGPVPARVGQPLSLPVAVRHPDGTPTRYWVQWAKHQGEGKVTFERPEIEVKAGESSAVTTATFSHPGTYLLRVQAVDDPRENGSYQFHCCWTTGYVEVSVAP